MSIKIWPEDGVTHHYPAKILLSDKDGNLVPCNYDFWYSGDDQGVCSGNYYVRSGEQPIAPETLSVIKKEAFKSGSSEGEGFHSFVRDLMNSPPTGVQFIRYDGVEKAAPPQEHWNFLGFKIAKRQRTRFVHHFSLCRLQTPLDEEHEAHIAEKKRQDAEQKSNLKQLEQELSPLSLNEFLKVSNQEIGIFDIVPIKHSEENTILTGYSLPSINGLVSLAKKNFVKKAPRRTKHVAAVQEEIVEIPSTFWVRGKQRITYCGVALVLKGK